MTEPSPALPAPPAARPKKVLIARVFLVIVVVAVLAGFASGIAQLLQLNLGDYKVGACIDTVSLSTSSQQVSMPKVVDCADSSAKAKIVAFFDGKRFAEAETVCPSTAVAAIELKVAGGQTRLLCLVLH